MHMGMHGQRIRQVGEQVVGGLETSRQERHGCHYDLLSAQPTAVFLGLKHCAHQVVGGSRQTLSGEIVQIVAQLGHRDRLPRFAARNFLFAHEEIVEPLAEGQEICIGHAEHRAENRGIERRRHLGGHIDLAAVQRGPSKLI